MTFQSLGNPKQIVAEELAQGDDLPLDSVGVFTCNLQNHE